MKTDRGYARTAGQRAYETSPSRSVLRSAPRPHRLAENYVVTARQNVRYELLAASVESHSPTRLGVVKVLDGMAHVLDWTRRLEVHWLATTSHAVVLLAYNGCHAQATTPPC